MKFFMGDRLVLAILLIASHKKKMILKIGCRGEQKILKEKSIQNLMGFIRIYIMIQML